MSRRTPVKELMAEEAGTPNSPIRRSTRIAGRRTSMTEEGNDLDRLSVSSAGSQKSVGTKTRAASKSPLSMIKEDLKGPAKRTRRRGSTSSLIEEELESISRSSPVPAKLSRRIINRSISCSPVSEIENKGAKTSTPQKDKTPGRRGRKLSSLAEPMVILESIKEIETKSPTIDESRDEDLPFKKKKAVLMHTISEKAAEDFKTPIKSNGDVHAEEGDKEHHTKRLTPKDKVHILNTSKKDGSILEEEKELVVLLQNISGSESNESSKKDAPKSKAEDVPQLNLRISQSDEDSETGDKPDSTDASQNEEDTSKSAPTTIEESSDNRNDITDTATPSKSTTLEGSSDEPNAVTDTATPSKSTTIDGSSDEPNAITDTATPKTKDAVAVPDKLGESVVSEKDSFNISESNSIGEGREHEESTISADSPDVNVVAPKTNDESLTSNKPETPKSQSSSPNKSLPPSLDASIGKDGVAGTTENLPDESLPTENESSKDAIDNSNSQEQEPGNSEKAKVSSPANITMSTGPVLVASNMTPLRRSPRLYTHGKDSPDTTGSSKSKNRNETATPKKSSGETKVKETVKNDSFKSGNLNEDEKKLNKTYNSSIDMELDPLLKEKIATLTETLEVDSSSSEDEGSVTHFIDDMAEEGEEDTPSEGSNDIIDLGESVGSTASQIDSDESYEVDSFIDDNEEEIELLSGEEYDLTQEKPKKSGKLKRILQIESSDEDEKDQVNHVNDKEAIKSKEDSDIENMSTRPYCGLSPPTVISVRDSPECDEKLQNNKDEEKSTTLINKEDNLESLEKIKEQNGEPDSSETSEITEEKSIEESHLSKVKTSNSKSETSLLSNNSVLDIDSSLLDNKRRRKSSISIQENVSLKEIADGSVSDHILKVVEVFCSTVNKSKDLSAGNISLNFSLDYVDASPQKAEDEGALGRKRVMSDSGVDFYLAKKRNSREEIMVSSPSKRKSVELPSPEKKEAVHSPKKKIKVAQTEDQASVTESSKENKSPKKLKGKKSVPQIVVSEYADVEIPNQKRMTPKKQTPKKSNANDSMELEQSESVSPQKKGKKQKRKSKLQEVPNKDADFSFTDYDFSIFTEKRSSPLKQNENKFVESEEIYEEIIMESEKLEDEVVPTKKTKKSKRIADSADVMEGDSEMPAKKKSKKKHLESDVKDLRPQITKGKKEKKKKVIVEEVEDRAPSSSDSEMSDDLDKQIHGKYNAIDKKRLKSAKTEKGKEVQTPSADSSWQIQYLPSSVKKALAKSNVTKSIAKHTSEIVIKSNRKPNLLPSSNNLSDSWQSENLNVSTKPTTSKIVTQLHAKDFKTRTTFDPKRVKRMATKELLKKKEKMM